MVAIFLEQIYIWKNYNDRDLKKEYGIITFILYGSFIDYMNTIKLK